MKRAPAGSVSVRFPPWLGAAALPIALQVLSGPAPAQVDAAAPPSAVSAQPTTGSAEATGSKANAVYNPTWESQKQARTWFFNVPAPRGQICDRHGEPLAQQRVGWNLALLFPRPFQFQDPGVDAFVAAEARKISALLGREIQVQPGVAQKHYRNRPLLPWILLQNLSVVEQDAIRKAGNSNWELLPFYARHYPNGKLAGHVLGYVGRSGKFQEGPVENNEPLFPDTEGRFGLEKTFDQVLRGEAGQWNVTYNGAGNKASEQISISPVAGKHVITTLDLALQRMAEAALAAGTKRGAMVIMDPQNGDVLALASWPPLDPALFVPAISDADYAGLSGDKNNPLFPRFSMAAYPPGSTFKCFVGLAALASGKLSPADEFDCPPRVPNWGQDLPQLEKRGARDAEFCRGARTVLQHVVLPGRLEAGRRCDYRLRAGAGVRRANRDSHP